MGLAGKTILLGVTGSIAAYKAVELVSRLRKADADVHVVMTENATRFVTPLTFQTISRHPVHWRAFDDPNWKPEHVALADTADLCVVAPATANVIAKLAYGIADDLLTSILVAVRCPILVAPAMNVHMYENPIVQENLDRLRRHGVTIAEPDEGMLADGYEGRGRLQEIGRLFAAIEALADALDRRREGDLSGQRVLVTAGPTREPIDPVRFLSNRSSGKMGYAIAEEAAARGAQVTLVSGPTALPIPPGVHRIDVETAREMYDAALAAFEETDVAVLCAAVADFEADEVALQKIKKGPEDGLTLRLRKTPDIARALGERKGEKVLIGFAAETENPLENARRKLVEKHLDLIVLNDVSQPGAGFETDTNIVTFVFADGTTESLPLLPKRDVARRLWDAIRERLLAASSSSPGAEEA